MLEEFLKGKISVFLDKENKPLIKEFYDLVIPYLKGYAPPIPWSSMDRYFYDKHSGPYHIVRANEYIVTGCGPSYIANKGIPTIHVMDFMKQCNNIDLKDDDFESVFK